MTAPATITFGKLLVLLGTGTTPETYVAPCGFTDKSLDLKGTAGETDVPDCDDPDAPVWTARSIKALSAAVTGQGVLSQAAHVVWRSWYFSGASKNVRVQLNLPAAQGGGHYDGAAVLTDFKIDGTHGEKLKITVNIDSDGPWTWTDATT